MTKKYLLSFAFVLLTTASTFAQVFSPGYIITNELDTLYGQLANNSYSKNNLFCEFRLSEESEIQKYEPFDIKAYRFLDDKFYVSKTIYKNTTAQNVFLEYIINGKIDIYALKENGEDKYYIQKGNDSLIYLENDLKYYEIDPDTKEAVLLEKAGYQQVTSSKRYLGTLTYLMAEEPTLQNQIKTTQLNHKSLTRIAKKYHNAVCKDEECIIYEKKETRALIIGIDIKVCNSTYYNQFTYNPRDLHFTSTEIVPSIYLLTQIVGVSKNLYLKSELGINKINSDLSIVYEYKQNYFQLKANELFAMPLSVIYYIPTKIIQPYIQFGIQGSYTSNLNFYSDNSIYENISDRYYWPVSFSIVASSGIKADFNKISLSTGFTYYNFLNGTPIYKNRAGINLSLGYKF